jgi:hypothetical protein
MPSPILARPTPLGTGINRCSTFTVVLYPLDRLLIPATEGASLRVTMRTEYTQVLYAVIIIHPIDVVEAEDKGLSIPLGKLTAFSTDIFENARCNQSLLKLLARVGAVLAQTFLQWNIRDSVSFNPVWH